MVKAAMIEKGVDYEEIHALPNQEADYLQQSPMGKVPCLETDQGFLTESGVMLDYIEAIGSGPSLYPADPWQRAKAQELIRYLELYIELPGRRLYGDVFFEKPASDALKAEVKVALEKGFSAFTKIAKYDPWLAGKDFGYADLYFLYSVSVVARVCKASWDWDVYEQYPQMKELIDRIKQRESVQKVAEDQAAA